MRKKILTVVGTRPNFIKVTQFDKEFAKYPDEFEHKLLHTGQHFDERMSEIFFEQLELKEPDFFLNIHSGTPGEQTGMILHELSKVINEWKPDLMLVVGDVNSTLAAALAANKSGTLLAHVESGLRSDDRTMPEEINRLITDEISDFLFVTEKSGKENLIAAGKDPERIFFVGNTMIDALMAFDTKIQDANTLHEYGLESGNFVLMTMHRPGNVDDPIQLNHLLKLVQMLSGKWKVVFPIHPRTRSNLYTFGLSEKFEAIQNLQLVEPMDYLGFQNLISHCALVITDSGGIQEETTFRKKPCLTLRPNTERPVTIEMGTNELVPFDLEKIEDYISRIEHGEFKEGTIPPLWDGKATQRLVEALRKII